MNQYDLLRNHLDVEEPFALATVVRCEPPASARPGAKAVIRQDGSLEGWVGGSCAQTIIVKEAQRALQNGRPRLVRLSPNPGEYAQAEPDLVEYLMTCHSGGTLEIFVEPFVPRPILRIVGDTPVASTLASIAQTLGYRVERIDPADSMGAAPGPVAVVIATMGSADEEALEAALRSSAPYVALVASPRRAEVLRDYLTARGLTAEQIARLKAPAGLDIGAVAQEEIALSIMAEIVQRRPSREQETPSPLEATDVDATDPVCGMSVPIHGARFTAERDGITYYFCSEHCRGRFKAAPLSFATASR
jgi:xanthine dehydrogenase accessory factor